MNPDMSEEKPQEFSFKISSDPETTAKCAETSLSLSPIEVLLFGNKSTIAMSPKSVIPFERLEKRLVASLRLDHQVYALVVKLVGKHGKDGALCSYLASIGEAGTGLYPVATKGKKKLIKGLKYLLKTGLKHETVPDINWQKEEKPEEL